MSETAIRPPSAVYEQHAVRGRFDAAFFRAMDPYVAWNLHTRKQRLFMDLPRSVVEIGPGVGANMRYLAPGSTLVAIEPNRDMHDPLRGTAARRRLRRGVSGPLAEETG